MDTTDASTVRRWMWRAASTSLVWSGGLGAVMAWVAGTTSWSGTLVIMLLFVILPFVISRLLGELVSLVMRRYNISLQSVGFLSAENIVIGTTAPLDPDAPLTPEGFRLSIGRFNIEPRLPSFRNPLKRKLMTVRVENVKILILPHSQRASGAPKETQAAQKPQQQQRASSRSMAIDHPYAGIFVSILAAFTTLLVELVVDDVIIGVLPKSSEVPILLVHLDKWVLDTVVKSVEGNRFLAEIELTSSLAPFRARGLSPHFRAAAVDFYNNVNDRSGFDSSYWSASGADDDGQLQDLSSIAATDNAPYVADFVRTITPTVTKVSTRVSSLSLGGVKKPTVRINMGQITSRLFPEDVMMLSAFLSSGKKGPEHSVPLESKDEAIDGGSSSSSSSSKDATSTPSTKLEHLAMKLVGMAFSIELFFDTVEWSLLLAQKARQSSQRERINVTINSILVWMYAHPEHHGSPMSAPTRPTTTASPSAATASVFSSAPTSPILPSSDLSAQAGVELGLSITGFAAFTSGQDQRMTGRLVRSSTFVPVTILPQLLFASVPLSTSSAFATQSISLQTMLDGLRCDLDLPRLEQQFFSTASASATAPTAARLKPLIPQTIARRLLGVQVSLSMRIVDSTVIVLATESLVTAVESTSVDLDLGFPTNTSADVHATFCVQLNNLFVNAVDHAISYDRHAYAAHFQNLQGNLLALDESVLTISANVSDPFSVQAIPFALARTDVVVSLSVDGLASEITDKHVAMATQLLASRPPQQHAKQPLTNTPVHPRKLEVAFRAKAVACSFVTPTSALVASISTFIIDREFEVLGRPSPMPSDDSSRSILQLFSPSLIAQDSLQDSTSSTRSPLPANRLVTTDLRIAVADTLLGKLHDLVTIESATANVLLRATANVLPIALAISHVHVAWSASTHVTLINTILPIVNALQSLRKPKASAEEVTQTATGKVPSSDVLNFHLTIATIGVVEIDLAMAGGGSITLAMTEAAYVSEIISSKPDAATGRFIVSKVTARTHGGGVLLISNIEIPLPSSSSSLEKATVDDLLTYTKDVKVEELERPLLVTIFAEEALCTEEADFAAWVIVEDVLNTIKAIQTFQRDMFPPPQKQSLDKNHDVPSRTIALRLIVQSAQLDLMDVPFEAKLGRNYRVGLLEQIGRLLRDESLLSRVAALNTQEYHDSLSVITGSTATSTSSSEEAKARINSLYGLLQRKNAESYQERIATAMQQELASLFKVRLEKFDGVAILTESVLSRSGLYQHLRRIDPTSNWTDDTPVEFDFFHGFHFVASASSVRAGLRDYPLPLFLTANVKTIGTAILAEELAPPNSRREVSVKLWPPPHRPQKNNRQGSSVDVLVTRTATPVKTFFDMHTWFGPDTQFSYGNCYEGAISEMSEALGALAKESDDPSPRLPFWDKLRILLHGRHTAHCESATVHVLATTDPYNTHEQLEVVFSKPLVGALHTHGFEMEFPGFSTLVRTNGCHDGSVLLQAGPAKLEGSYVWTCLGDPDAHHHIFPTPVCNVSADALASFDTYRHFRSSSLAVVTSIKASDSVLLLPGDKSVSVRLYSNTMIWLEKFVANISNAMVPARRGPIFTTIPRRLSKKKLSKHLQGLELHSDIATIALSYCHSLEQPLGLAFHASKASFKGALALLPVVDPQSGGRMRWMPRWARLQMTEMHGFIERDLDAEADIAAAGAAVPAQDYNLQDFSVEDFVQAPDCVPAEENMYEMLYAPHMDYFLDNSGGREQVAALQDDVDVSSDSTQLTQCKKRMHETEAMFEKLSVLLAQIQATQHDSNGQDGRDADDVPPDVRKVLNSIETLARKRQVLASLIDQLQARISDASNKPSDSSQDNASTGKSHSTGHKYTTRFVFHSPRGIWSQITRNSLMRLFYLSEQERALHFSLSRRALQLVQQYLSSILRSTGVSATAEPTAATAEDKESGPEDDTEATAVTATGTLGSPQRQPDPPSVDEGDSSMNDGGDLLSMLLAQQEKEGLSIVVASDGIEDDRPMASAADVAAAAISPKATAPAQADALPPMTSEGHANDSDGSAVSDHDEDARLQVIHDVVVELVSPQVYFESTKGSEMGYVLLVAQRTRHTIHNLYEVSTQQHYKKIIESSFKKTKFFIGYLPDIDGHWPVWAPVECVGADDEFPEQMKRVMVCPEIRVTYSNGNPLFVTTALQNVDDGMAEKTSTPLAPFCRSIWEIDFPTFVFVAENQHFNIVTDIVQNLLLYKEPRRKHDASRLETMLYQAHLGRMQLSEESMKLMQAQLRLLLNDNVSIKRDLFLARSRQGQEVLLEDLLKNDEPQSRISANEINRWTEEALLEELQANSKELAAAKQSLLVLLEAVKRMGRDPMTEKVDMDEKFRWTLDQVVWAMQRSDVAPEDPHKTFTELQMQNVQWSLDIANDGSGVNMLEIDQVHMVNRLQDPVFQELIAPFNPTRQSINFSRHKMARVLMRNGAPVAGIPVIELFEMNIHPVVFRMTHELFQKVQAYIFHSWAPPANLSSDTISSNDPDITAPLQKIPAPRVATLDASSSAKSSLSNAHGRRRSSQSSQKRVPLQGRASIDDSASFVFVPDDRNLPYTSIANKGIDDVNEMKERASNTRVFIYIQIPRFAVSVSYKGEKDKNFEDVTGFMLQLPTFQYHNKTWKWVDFWTQGKKDMTRALLMQTGSLVKEKLLGRKKDVQEEFTGSIVDVSAGSSAIAPDHLPLTPHPVDSTTGHTDSSKPSKGILSNIFGKKKQDPSTTAPAANTTDANTVAVSSSTADPSLEDKKRILFGKFAK